MAAFTTFNQFSKDRYEIYNFSTDCNACPFFALITSYNFMLNGEISKEQHEKNLDAAVINRIVKSDLPKYLAFDELVMFTGGTYYADHVQGTTPEIINMFGYDPIFDLTLTQNHAVIFLKNGNFIVVLVRTDGNSRVYAVRDCHENTQYNFENFDDLELHLASKYQFNELTVVDGVLIEEFGNIEYLCVNKPFQLLEIDPELHDD